MLERRREAARLRSDRVTGKASGISAGFDHIGRGRFGGAGGGVFEGSFFKKRRTQGRSTTPPPPSLAPNVPTAPSHSASAAAGAAGAAGGLGGSGNVGAAGSLNGTQNGGDAGDGGAGDDAPFGGSGGGETAGGAAGAGETYLSSIPVALARSSSMSEYSALTGPGNGSFTGPYTAGAGVGVAAVAGWARGERGEGLGTYGHVTVPGGIESSHTGSNNEGAGGAASAAATTSSSNSNSTSSSSSSASLALPSGFSALGSDEAWRGHAGPTPMLLSLVHMSRHAILVDDLRRAFPNHTCWTFHRPLPPPIHPGSAPQGATGTTGMVEMMEGSENGGEGGERGGGGEGWKLTELGTRSWAAVDSQ